MCEKPLRYPKVYSYAALESDRHIRLLSILSLYAEINEPAVSYDIFMVSLDSSPPFEAM